MLLKNDCLLAILQRPGTLVNKKQHCVATKGQAQITRTIRLSKYNSRKPSTNLGFGCTAMDQFFRFIAPSSRLATSYSSIFFSSLSLFLASSNGAKDPASFNKDNPRLNAFFQGAHVAELPVKPFLPDSSAPFRNSKRPEDPHFAGRNDFGYT